MFRPDPVDDRGHRVLRLERRAGAGTAAAGEPGTLEMTRFSGALRLLRHRDPRGHARRAGEQRRRDEVVGVLEQRRRESHVWRSLAERIAALHPLQPPARVRLVGRQRHDHRRDPVAERAALRRRVRTDTGHHRQQRVAGQFAALDPASPASLPAQIVITTSLTVQPAAFLIALTSSSGELTRTRPGDAARCALEARARRVSAPETPPSAPRRDDAATAAWSPRGTRRGCGAASGACPGGEHLGQAARPRGWRAIPPGASIGSPGCCSAPLPRGRRRDPRATVSSSTAQDLGARHPVDRGVVDLGQQRQHGRRASPWITYSSHSGRARSSGRATRSAATCSPSWRSVARAPAARARGRGTRDRTRSSSTQYGWSIPSGTVTSRHRNGGSRWIRSAISERTRSASSADPSIA